MKENNERKKIRIFLFFLASCSKTNSMPRYRFVHRGCNIAHLLKLNRLLTEKHPGEHNKRKRNMGKFREKKNYCNPITVCSLWEKFTASPYKTQSKKTHIFLFKKKEKKTTNRKENIVNNSCECRLSDDVFPLMN